MTVPAMTHDDVLATVVRARDRFIEDASYWRRCGLGVEEIRRAIAYEELARDLDDAVANLRMTRPANADDLSSVRP